MQLGPSKDRFRATLGDMGVSTVQCPACSVEAEVELSWLTIIRVRSYTVPAKKVTTKALVVLPGEDVIVLPFASAASCRLCSLSLGLVSVDSRT